MILSQSESPCWNCQTLLSPLDFGRQDSCPKCGRDTRVCKACIFYDRSFNNECRESQADRVVDKEKSNFCDYFKPRSQPKPSPKNSSESTALKNSSPENSSRDALRAAAEALFKKK